MAVSALGGWSPVKLVFLTPLWFGIGKSAVVSCMRALARVAHILLLDHDQPTAHVHHAWETYVAGGRTRQALLRGTLQSSAFRGCYFSYSKLGNLTRATTQHSLSIRLHHHLWMVRRVPVPPDW